MRCPVLVGSAMASLALMAVVSSCDRAVSNAAADEKPVDPTDAPGPATPLELDMDAIFPPGDGRDLVLTHCTACHGLTRMVLTQRTKEHWNYVREKMRPSVPDMSDAQADSIFGYLAAHFNDATPSPKLPAWYLESVPW